MDTQAYTAISVPPLRSNTSPSSIQPLSSVSTDVLASETEEHVAQHSQSSKTVQEHISTTRVQDLSSDHLDVVAFRPAVQKCIIPSLIPSAALCTAPTLLLDHLACVDTPTSILAPVHHSDKPPSITQPHTSPRAAFVTEKTRDKRVPSPNSPIYISKDPPSLHTLISTSASDNILCTAALLVSTSPPPSISPPLSPASQLYAKFRSPYC